MDIDIDDFLVEPLYDHEHGLSAGLEEAAAQITAPVENWSQEQEVAA